jgi:hypothetical protein
MNTDITEQRQAKTALEARYQAIAEGLKPLPVAGN